MTTYALPAEPVGPVWLLEHPAADVAARGPIRFDRRPNRWCSADRDIEVGWVELLALGEVTDDYPGGYDLHATATPWEVADDAHIVGADGQEVAYVFGESTSVSDDVALAALIVELVNAHTRPRDEALAAADVVDGPADRLALAVKVLVRMWDRFQPLHAAVDEVSPLLRGALDSVSRAHTAIRWRAPAQVMALVEVVQLTDRGTP